MSDDDDQNEQTLTNIDEVATSIETNKLPTFQGLKKHEILAVTMRAEGEPHLKILNTINAEYDMAYKYGTIRQWFMIGGKLEGALNEYNEVLGVVRLRAAKTKIKNLTKLAADTLEETMKGDFQQKLKIQAANTVLAKFIPDRVMSLEGEDDADQLPELLANEGDEVVDGQSDDAQDSADSSPEARPEEG